MTNSRPLTTIRCLLLSTVCLLTTGCLVTGRVSVTVMPGGQGPGAPPTPPVPVIVLAYGGSSLPGVAGEYSWLTSQTQVSGSQSGGVWPLSSPGTLHAKPGETVDIVVSGSPPAAVTVTELNGAGTPIAVTAAMAGANRIPYALVSSGQYWLQITAQWGYQQYVTYYFEVEASP